MEFAEVRSRIRAVIFAIAGFIIAFLFLRICLDLISADQQNVIVNLINQITDILISPFTGLIVIPLTGILEFVNIDAIVGFIAYLLGAIVIAEVITAFIYDNVKDIFQNIIDALFKIIESFLFLRIVFDFFGVGLSLDSPQFVKIIYGFTEWAQGIIFNQPLGTGIINLSTIVCLIIVVVLDILAERFLDSIFDNVSKFVKSSSETISKIEIGKIIPIPSSINREKSDPKPNLPIQQNIIINVPVPQGASVPNGQPQVIIENKPAEG